MPDPHRLVAGLESYAIPYDGLPEDSLELTIDKLDADQLKLLFSHLHDLFAANPSIRIATVAFIHDVLSSSTRSTSSPLLVTSPFFPSLIRSLLLDSSPRLFSASIALFNSVFPYTPGELTPHVPSLMTVLARAACWRPRHTPSVSRTPAEGQRKHSTTGQHPGGPGLDMLNHTVPSGKMHYLSRSDDPDATINRDEYDLSAPRSPGVLNMLADALRDKTLPPRPDLNWKVLKGAGAKEEWNPSISLSSYPTLATASSSSTEQAQTQPGLGGASDQDLLLIPSQQLALNLLMDIHGMWPSNLVAFIRNQKGYLAVNRVECVYEGRDGWEGVWEEGEVAVRLSPLLKAFAFNPQAIFADATAELSTSAISRYSKLDPSAVVVAAHSLYRGYASPTGQGGQLSLTSGRAASGTSRLGGAIKDSSSGHGHGTSGDSPGLGSASGSNMSALSASSSPPNYKVARGEMSISGGLGMMMGGGYTAAKPIAIGGARGNESSEREVESLRGQVEDLKRELAHNADLKDLYLAHVHRLHKDSVTFASDQAERQLLFVSFKDQKKENAKLSAELAKLKVDSTRIQDTLKQSSDSLREKLSKTREDNRLARGETSQARAELEDANRSIENLQAELTKVKETNFRLNNKLIEADPHIRHIDDYREEIRIFKEGQLKWDADVRKLKAQDDTLATMTGRWRQMEDMVMASNRRAQKSAEEATELQEMVADRDEIIRRMNSVSARAQQVAPKAFFPPAQPREVDLLKRLLAEAKDRIETLNGEKLDLQSELEQFAFASQNQNQAGASNLL